MKTNQGKYNIRLEDMLDISEITGLSINKVFCGYLRQPITADKIDDKKYMINGHCSYYNKRCSGLSGERKCKKK
jgi:hypothetical protein